MGETVVTLLMKLLLALLCYSFDSLLSSELTMLLSLLALTQAGMVAQFRYCPKLSTIS